MRFPQNPTTAEEDKGLASLPWLPIPAILAILFCVTLGLSIRKTNEPALSMRYQGISRNAIEQKDYPTALVASLRLLSFGERFRNEALFNLALAHQGLGQTSDAANLLAMVAPDDKPVFAPAHLYVARSLIARTTAPSRETEDRIVAQLRNALILDPDSTEARALLARFPK